jgi:prevent-host-death family protein
MPEQIGIRELRDKLTATIRRVRAGETIEITHHREPVAVLAPVRRNRIDALVRSGELTRGKPLNLPIRKFAPTTGVTASQALEEDRADR